MQYLNVLTQICPNLKQLMAYAWHFVSNSLKFHLFHVISECSDSNMSNLKKCMANAWHFVSNSLKFYLFHAISECSDSNMSKSQVIYNAWHFVSNSLNFHLFHAIYLNVLTQICPG